MAENIQNLNVNRKLDKKLGTGDRMYKEDNMSNHKLESTFTKVRAGKNTLVQSTLDQHLVEAIGKQFVITGAEYQETSDYSDKNKINIATVYSVRVTNKQAWLPLGTEFQIKIKDHKPIFNQKELQDIMFGNIVHYNFGSGEVVNATGIHRLNIDVKEAMNYE